MMTAPVIHLYEGIMMQSMVPERHIHKVKNEVAKQSPETIENACEKMAQHLLERTDC